ncbi:hypothetical protein N7462_007768 [Penicillium macrosclerotiorum]|uniref:uncharacterized protein n=1 Tax=Penicillium macrosclerotiorum TaxID=303699 RepID=UPI00254667A1|nr:uncharacterized protein N7462_007768 [Penicillium macrosclerotiorum]KAJ5679524.1 hypothetical protein N7462_007768 [Penicillium macrosclerotiorum]
MAGQISDARFVHTSHWDIELHHSLTSPVPVRNLSLLGVPTFWNPSQLESLDRDLLEYWGNGHIFGSAPGAASVFFVTSLRLTIPGPGTENRCTGKLGKRIGSTKSKRDSDHAAYRHGDVALFF